MTEVYVLHDDGTHSINDLSYGDLKSTGVYIVVSINHKKLFIWKGSEAPVRQKFISARVAQDIRLKEYGMAYKVESEEQSEESSTFLQLFGVSAAEAGSTAKPSGPVVTASPGSSASRPVAAARPVAGTRPANQGRPVVTAQASPRPLSATRSAPTPTSTSKSPPVQTQAPKPTDFEVSTSASSPSKGLINKTLDKLKELTEPEGMQREIVLIGNSVYSAKKEYHKLFKKEIVKLDPMDELPDGAFPANDYYTRLYMEKGKVLFIELFSETPASAREEFLADMRSSLRDLTKLGI